MGIAEIRALKSAAGQPKLEKARTGIARMSEKTKARKSRDKELLAADKDFYYEVYLASPHKCQNCGAKLPKEPLTTFFHHLLNKHDYPELRHIAENIMIICPDCHTGYETNPSKFPKIESRKKEAEKLLLK